MVVILAVPTATICLSVIGFFAAVKCWPYPTIIFPPPASMWIEDRAGNPLAAFVSYSDDWQLPLPEKQISPHLLDAIVAVEDWRFYQHGGVDWQSMGKALCEDLIAGRARRGASTITMQLQRLRQPATRSVWGKIVQAIRAEQIEKRQSKREILIEYINRAPFGGNLVGAGAASWRYFGKPCGDLSLGQAALLAGLPQSPNRLRPDRHSRLAAARRNHVLDRMLACGMITPAQHDEAAKEPIDAQWRPLPQESTACDGLVPALTRLAESHPGQMLRVNIDVREQQQCAAAAKETLRELGPSHVTAAAVVVLDTLSGNCVASASVMSGRSSQSNAEDLTQCSRSSGSTLKPFIYAAAFDLGICTPATLLGDAPGDWAGYEPANYDHVFRGNMTASEALAQSRNLPAIGVLAKVGVGRAVELLRAAGFSTLSRTPDRYGLPLAVGGADVTPMELAEAYASLARGGQHRPASLLCEGSAVAAAAANHELQRVLPGPAIWPATCLATLNCIAAPERTARVCPSAVAIGPAWKTGTSSGHRDAWCAAVTPRRTVVVWLGNPDGSGADRLVGQESAAPLALKIIAALDPVTGQGFAPTTPEIHPASTAPIAVQSHRLAIQLISPPEGQQIVRDSTIADAAQRVPLRARILGLPNASKLWWFVDGQYLGSGASDETRWWSPQPGRHEVRVVDGDGRAAAADVDVR